jgi:spore germination protein KC
LKKLLACLALFVIMCGFLSGCWSRKELGELAIVLGAGVDRAPGNQVRLTLQLARPRAFAGGGETRGGGGEATTWVVSETGSTVQDAERKLAGRISRRIYWAHSGIVVFGEEAARHGMQYYTNFFYRAPHPRETTWVLVAKGEAKDILETSSELENSSAQDIGFLTRGKTVFPVNLKEIVIMRATTGTNITIPRVEVVDSGTALGPGLEKPAVHKGVALTGTAVFSKVNMLGWLDESETRGLLWLKGKILPGIIAIPSLTDPDKKMSVDIIRGRTKVEPQYDGDSVWFDVDIVVEGDLVEQQSSENILEREVRKAIEEKIAGLVEEKARQVLLKAQGEYGVDIFDFGVAFHRKYPKEWKDLKGRWDEVFSDAWINITVEAHLRSSGLQGIRTALEE